MGLTYVKLTELRSRRDMNVITKPIKITLPSATGVLTDQIRASSHINPTSYYVFDFLQIWPQILINLQ